MIKDFNCVGFGQHEKDNQGATLRKCEFYRLHVSFVFVMRSTCNMRQSIQEWTKQIFKGCLPQNVFSPLLNTLSHMLVFSGSRRAFNQIYFQIFFLNLLREINSLIHEGIESQILALSSVQFEFRFILHKEALHFEKYFENFIFLTKWKISFLFKRETLDHLIHFNGYYLLVYYMY